MCKSFVLITPARNEASFISGVLDSVVYQTLKPKKWIIVNNGSNDRTEEIVSGYAKKHAFIELINLSDSVQRSFTAKIRAFNAGHKRVQDLKYEFIGNLDADLTFSPKYYETMIQAFSSNDRLGAVSGVCWDRTHSGFRKVTISLDHAVGGIILARRKCFEAVGGYRNVSVAGEDAILERMIRMHGWETQAIPGVPVYHHKPCDTANSRNAIHASYRAGLTEYHIGTSPSFALLKALRRWRDTPTVANVFIRLFGYTQLWLKGAKRDAPEELVRYLRKEELRRVLALLKVK